MDFENEKKQDEQQSVEKDGSRDGYQREFRPVGRSPRPRIHTGQRPATSYERPNFSKRNFDDDGGFRPEGFGAGLQSQAPQRSYRPRTNNYNNGGYGQPRGGYRPRYNQEGDEQGYQFRQQGGYQPRQQDGYQPRGGYGQQGGYQPRQQGSYQSRGGYGQQGGYQPRQQGGYQSRGGYGQQRQQGGYQPRGGYGQRPQGGFRPRTADYDPNAKYSMKKRIEYKEQNFDPNEPIRLNKFLANAGVCSRREADDFIQAGVVTVNGEVVTELGTKVLRTDVVKFHEEPVSLEKKVYVLLNKPKDYVTTSDDPQQRKTVMDLVKDACPERIYPVGRLDRNTTGVLLLTNDGDLASKLTHPKFLKKKIYHVYLDHNVTARDLQQIAEGVTLDDGEIKADEVQYADPVDKKQVGIEIHSGKNRIVRRIFESLGYKVLKLDRVQFAGLTKKNLRRGDWRYLTEEEVGRLRMGAYE
ncbi:MAG: rRNA pseudouridine synthase [Prevotella sp.]|nr:rRNA pseudouridine synthase [Prevotella sp.]